MVDQLDGSGGAANTENPGTRREALLVALSVVGLTLVWFVGIPSLLIVAAALLFNAF